MKNIILLLVLFTNSCYAQLPDNSINLGNGVYGNKNKASADIAKIPEKKTTSDCTCTLQDVLNNGYVTDTNPYIYLEQSPATQSNNSYYGYDGMATYYSGVKIFDVGQDYTLSVGDAYVHLFDQSGAPTITLNSNGNLIQSEDNTFLTQHLPNGINVIKKSGFGIEMSLNTTSAGNVFLIQNGLSSGNYNQVLAGSEIPNALNHLPKHSGNIATDDGNTETQTLSGATSVITAHGLTWTPRNIIPTPLDAFTAAYFAGGWYLSAITSTTFTITFLHPITGTINYIWQAF